MSVIPLEYQRPLALTPDVVRKSGDITQEPSAPSSYLTYPTYPSYCRRPVAVERQRL